MFSGHQRLEDSLDKGMTSNCSFLVRMYSNCIIHKHALSLSKTYGIKTAMGDNFIILYLPQKLNARDHSTSLLVHL